MRGSDRGGVSLWDGSGVVRGRLVAADPALRIYRAIPADHGKIVTVHHFLIRAISQHSGDLFGLDASNLPQFIEGIVHEPAGEHSAVRCGQRDDVARCERALDRSDAGCEQAASPGNDGLPGPRIDEHLAALQRVLHGETVTHILITHTHTDHSPAAAPLKAATGAPTYGFGPHGSGKLLDGVTVEAGGDMDFQADIEVRDGTVIEGDGWSVECVYTPGHTSNHICFGLREEQALFTGDHVMGWSTTVIVPPDGDMGQYFQSLERLQSRTDRRFYPTHGNPIQSPAQFVTALIAHRRAREAQIAACLARQITHIPAMVAVIYSEIDPKMHPAAALSVRAHLEHMVTNGQVRTQTTGTASLAYQLA